MSLWSSMLALIAPTAAKLAVDGVAMPEPPKATRPSDYWSFDATAPKPSVNPFEPRRDAMPPGVGRSAPKMAMDDAFLPVSQWALSGLQTMMGAEREGFVGYPELAAMAQRPEYRAIVEIIAQEATRKWIKIQSAGDDDKTDKIKAIENEFTRLGVRDAFRAISEQDGFYGRSHLYLDLGDGQDLEELAKPIGDGRDKLAKAKIGKGALKAIRTVEAVWCYPVAYDSLDPLSVDWYRPTMWWVMSKQVHASRLLTFIGRKVPDLLKPAYQFGGLSMTQMVRPVVENWIRTRKSVGDIVNAFSIMVFKTNMTEAINAGGSPAQIFKRAELFNLLRDNRGLMMVDKTNEDFSNVSAPLGGLSDLQAQAQEHMASLPRIPVVKLLGIQPAGLNASSEGELTCFEDNMLSYQEAFFRPNLTILLDVVQCSLFGAADPAITFAFEPLGSLDETELATLQKQHADTATVHLANGVISREEERQRIAADPKTPYASLDTKDVPDLAPTEAATVAQSSTTAIVAAFSAGITDRPTALKELKAMGEITGIGAEIDDALIKEAEEEPPAPDPSTMGMQPGAQPQGGPTSGAGDPQGGGPQGESPKGQPPAGGLPSGSSKQLAGDAFDPNELRENDGKWSASGGGGGAAAAAGEASSKAWTTGTASRALQSLSSNTILAEGPPRKPNSVTKDECAAELNQRGKKALKEIGIPSGRIEGPDPKTDVLLAHAIATEIKTALDRDVRSGANWYTQQMQGAMAIASVLHPELATNTNDKFAFTACLAITSQGETVTRSAELADDAYETFKTTGLFPEVSSAADPNIVGNFIKCNALIKRLGGVDGAREFFDKKMTSRELFDLTGFDSGENKNEPVFGSAILGPKIGNGFFQNLNGQYDPVTMDLWFMRAWGRLTGTLIGTTDMAKTTDRLTSEMAKAGQAVPKSDAALANAAEAITKAHEKDFKVNRADYDSGAKKKSQLVLSAERYLYNRGGFMVDQPGGGGARKWMRSVINAAREQLAKEGVPLTNADMQATWWYPEKALYKKMGVRVKEIDVDYSDALRKLAKKKNVDDARIDAALRSVAGRSGPNAGDEQGAGRGDGRADRSEVPRAGEEAAGRAGGAGDDAFSGSVAFLDPEFGVEVPPELAGLIRVRRNGRTIYLKADPNYAWTGDAYDPDEARENDGKWTAGGGGSGSGGAAAKAGSAPAASGFRSADPKAFIAARDKSSRAYSLSPVTENDLEGHKLLLSDDGSVGVAVSKDGDVQNLFNNGGPKGSGVRALAAAVAAGGRTLDCYDPYLPKLYGNMGFVETGRMKFDPAQAHGDFKGESPDVVFMAWKAYVGGEDQAIKKAQDSDAWGPHEQSANYETDWDAAKARSAAQADAGRGEADRQSGKSDRPEAARGGDPFGAGSGESDRGTLTPYAPGLKAGAEGALAVKKDWRTKAPNDLETLIKGSPQNQSDLVDAVRSVMPGAKDPGVKKRDRIEAKMARGKKVNQLNDVVRCGFDAPTPEQGDAVVKALAKKFEVVDEGWSKTEHGYFDRTIMVRFGNGQIGEVQMWPPGMLDAKSKQGGHALYAEWQGLPAKSPRALDLNEKMNALYAGVRSRLDPKTWVDSLFKARPPSGAAG